eukprot:m.288770 g.288770  ORF g.288770 m.288770 type:complete len:1610 (-) comp19453_c0_seq5:24-4853(-)
MAVYSMSEALAAASATPPPAVVVAGPVDSDARALAAKLATLLHTELLDPTEVLREATEAARVVVEAERKAEAAATRGGGEAEEEEEGEGEPVEDEDEEADEDEDDDDEMGPAPQRWKPTARPPPSETAREAYALLCQGASVGDELVTKLMTERAQSDVTLFRGYVLCGFPETEDQLAVVQRWQLAPSVYVNLQMASEDVEVRCAGQRGDVATNAPIAADVIEKVRLAADLANARGDDDDDEEGDGDEDDLGFDDEEGDDEEDEQDPLGPEEVLPTPQTVKEIRLPNAGVLERLVVRPEDEPSAITAATSRFREHVAPVLSTLAATIARTHHLLIDGTDPLHAQAERVLRFLEWHGIHPIVEPRVLENPDFEEDPADDNELLASVARLGLEDEDEEEVASWTAGPFGPYCPVSFCETGAFVRGTGRLVVAHLGTLFLFADEAKRNAFVVAPNKYLFNAVSVPCRVLLLGSADACAALAPALAAACGAQEKTLGAASAQQPAAEDVGGADAAPLQQQATVVDELRALLADSEARFVAHACSASDVVAAVAAANQVNHQEPEVTLADGAAEDEAGAPVGPLAASRPGFTVALVLVDDATDEAGDDHEAGGDRDGDEDPASTAAALVAQELQQAEINAVVVPKRQQLGDAPVRLLRACLSAAPFPAEVAPHDVDEDEEDPAAVDLGWGDTGRFCPVALRDQQLLRAGSSDFAARYQGRFYRMHSEAARDAFVANPPAYLAGSLSAPTLPPPRFCFVGPPFAGKTLVARRFARRQRVVHVSFQDRVAEAAHSPASPHHDAAKLFLDDPESGPLDAAVAAELVVDLWRNEPFATRGFVLEGFPRSEEDMRCLSDLGAVPELVVAFSLQEASALRRALPKKLAAWQKQRDEVLAKREKKRLAKLEAKAQHRRDWEQAQAENRSAREAQRQAVLVQRQADGGDDDDELDFEEEEEEEEEYQEPEEDEEEEEELEDPEDAKDRISEEIVAANEAGVEGAEAVVGLCREELKVAVVELNADRSESVVRASFENLAADHVSRRASLLAYARPIPYPVAMDLLRTGRKLHSHLGFWCPVDLLALRAAQPNQKRRYAVEYRGRIYFLSSREAKRDFLSDPERFVRVSAPRAAVGLRIAIVGPPKSGKTTLASRLADEFSCKRVSMGSALRQYLAEHSGSHLAQQVRAELASGRPVSDHDAMAVLCRVLHQAQPQGFVLDGFPQTLAQANALIDAGLVPAQIIQLELDRASLLDRAARDRQDNTLPLHDCDEILDVRSKAFYEHCPSVNERFASEFRNWQQLPGQKSKWWLSDQAGSIVRGALQSETARLDRVMQGRSAPVAGVSLPITTIQEHLSKFQTYCPVALRRGELVSTPVGNLTHTAEFKGEFFKLCGDEELRQFLDDPTSFIGLELPAALPQRLAPHEVKEAFPQRLELRGYCPVTYVAGGRRYESIKAGLQACCVEYGGRIYALAGETEVDEFMRQPASYENLKLPKKLPPKLQPVAVASLPMLGYLEQTVAEVVIKGFTAVGLSRPKYPFLTSQQSALIYLALYLKVHNPKTATNDFLRRKWRRKLEQFQERCDLLRALGQGMRPAYTPPSERPFNFDHNLATFLSIKGAIANK